MSHFTAAWPDSSIVQRVVAQIPWLLPDDLKGSLPTMEEIEAEFTRKGMNQAAEFVAKIQENSEELI